MGKMGNQPTILVVEDNDFVRMQIVSFLKEAGHVVAEATDGNEALETIGKDTVLAVVDVRMEPMGGFDFLNLIRADGYTIPVILVTGDQTHDLLERANKAGVGSVLMKPVQKERLVTTVDRLLKKGAAARS